MPTAADLGRLRHKGLVHGDGTVHLDRVEGERLVFAHALAMAGRRHSASLGTVESPWGAAARA